MTELRKALEQIAAGTDNAFEFFKARMEGRTRPTWRAVNVLQEYLEAAQGTALAALASQSPPPTDEDETIIVCTTCGHSEGCAPPTDDVRAALGGYASLEDFAAVLHDASEALTAQGAETMGEIVGRALSVIRALSAQLPPPIRGEERIGLSSEEFFAFEAWSDEAENAVMDPKKRAALQLLLAALNRLAEQSALATPSSPEGWVLVPRKPTEEMIAAAWGRGATKHQIRAIYYRLLAASPSSTENKS